MKRTQGLGLLLLAFAACDGSSGDDDSAPSGLDPGSGASGPGNPSPGTPNPPVVPGDGAERPPEREVESRYLAPVATDKYLWTANPLSGRVALIDATSLAVTLTTAGNAPTRVAGLPALDGGRVGALVLNERSDDATLFRLSADGKPEKYPALPTHGDANAWAVSPSGRFAIAWTDAALKTNPDRLETFQDITLLSLEPDAESARPLSVGARPSRFEFSEDGAYAYAVTEEGLSVIALEGEPRVSDLILFEDSLEAVGVRDVSFAPDISYAVVRREGGTEIGVVSLPGGELERVTLPGVVTDVDLAPNGAEVWAVLGVGSEVVRFSVADALDGDPTLDRASLGSAHAIGAIALNSDASAAVLYSTVVDANRITLVATEHLAGEDALTEARRYDLIAPVTAVFPAPDPRFAVAFQGRAANSQKAGGFSVLSLTAPRAPRIVATDATPVQIAFSPEVPSALVTVRSDSTQRFGAYVIDLVTQQVDFVALASPPEAAGVIAPAARAFVAQSHPEGRITFISTEDQSVQTLTGFELAARIKSD